MTSKKVLVTGDRNGYDPNAIEAVLRELWDQGYRVLVHGGARGVDSQADAAGRSIGYEVRVYPADWATHHRAAGPIRNKHMLVMEMPGLVVALHSDMDNSKGTKDCIRQARKMGITVWEAR